MAKVMLVEDDNNLREIYEARLQAEGYTIVSAKDGEEALVIAKQEKPDLIISDVMMPKISGFEMLDILRNTDGLKDTRVIMLTALGQSDDQQRADKLGADRYLVKSQVTLEDIVKVAHELLQDNPATAAAPPVAAPDPVPTPPAPTPQPAATPAEPPTDATPAEPAAQSTAQEEATVDNQIENFVEGASSETSTPVEAPTDEVVTAPDAPISGVAGEPNPAVDTVAMTAKAADTASDDKLMAEAAEALAADTAETAQPPVSTVAPTVTPIATTTAPAPAAPAVTAVAPQADEATSNDSVTVAHKKIIRPLDSEPKTDIASLVALEEAKEAAAAPSVPPVVVVSGDKTGPATSATPPAPAVTDEGPSGGAAPPSPTAAGSDNPLDDPHAIAL